MIDFEIAGKSYSVGHPIFGFITALHNVQGKLYCLPKWGDFEPLELGRQLIYYCEHAIKARSPKQYEMFIVELAEYLEGQVEFVAGGLRTTKADYIAVTSQNQQQHALYVAIDQAIHQCVVACERIKYESAETSPNLIYILEVILQALTVMSRWAYEFYLALSTNEEGEFVASVRFNLMDEDALKRLNV